MGSVTRLRTTTHETVASQLQLVLELPLKLRPETRQELTEALSLYSPEVWSFVMIGREASLVILQRIVTGERPGVTLAVWEAARLCSAYGTGEIEATRTELAAIAGTNDREVSRALVRLTDIGGLVCIRRGRYALHPTAAWSGTLRSRLAAKGKLELVES